MPDYFDRYIRNRHHFLKIVEYIRNNGNVNADVSIRMKALSPVNTTD